jgi:hypothetical protein
MKPTQDKYPVFEANQVLSNSHLNQVFNYLDEQERLTRANLIGIGIVCGLEISLDVIANVTTINISKGCGISSEGYLIVEPEDISLVSYRDYTLPIELNYPKFKDQSAKQFDLWELFPAGEPETKSLVEPQNFLSDKAVLLFLELKKEGLRNCSPNNCDDRGANVTATVRRLLVKKADLKSISESPLVKFQELSVQALEVPMRRIHFSTPEDLHSYQDVFKGFFAQQVNGKTVVVRLSEAIEQAYEVVLTLLPDLNSFDKSGLAAIFTFPANADVIAIQYYYDLLRDLTTAYHELRAALLEQLAICLPNSDFFPRHLTLGVMGSSNALEWRTGYFSSPAVAPPHSKLKELRFLFNRLNQIVSNFKVQSGTAVALKITPSHYGFKTLSGKSLPFYYKPELREHWDAFRRGEKAKEILSWHDDVNSPDHVRNPLQYDLEPYNFFRVEGIIGKNIIDLSTDLGTRLKTSRLPFSVLHVNADKIGNFLEKHYAIEHEAGALRGGTLVVVHNETGPNANLVSADFALPYRIEKDGDCLGRVMVKECDYEWFDSRKHLSNLAQREYRFVPRPAVHGNSQQKESQEADKALLAEYYVIVVYRYDIQGQTLIGNSPVQVRVPIAELIKGQLSVIARKLNEQFPGGLVFDHKPNTNKLYIRYFSDHTFRIEWGGLQGNQIRYAYTPDGIYRWQKGSWEPLDHLPNFKVQCRLRNEYRADEYKWLQEDDYFDADYPSSPSLPTAEELIKWESMIKKRAPAAITDLPINSVIGRIGHVINEYYNVGAPQVSAVLIGSWANGSWVCRDSSKNKFPAGFLALRQKVTGKTGQSDIDLLVETQGDGISVESLLNVLNDDKIINNSGYGINIFVGKKNAQKGLALN